MRASLAFVLTLLLATSVSAYKSVRGGIPAPVGLACWYAAREYDNTCSVGNLTACRCGSPIFMGSVTNCIDRWTSIAPRYPGLHFQENNPFSLITGSRREEFEVAYGYSVEALKAYKFIQDLCYQLGPRFQYSIGHLEAMAVEAKEHVIGAAEAEAQLHFLGEVRAPVAVRETRFIQYLYSMDVVIRQYSLGIIQGVVLNIYWALVIFVGFATNVFYSYFPDVVRRMKGPRITWFRRHFTLPATIGTEHNAPHVILKYIQIHLPTRIHSIVIAIYVLLTVVLTIFPIHFSANDPYLGTSLIKFARYTGNRTGLVALTQIPLLVLFGGRNNILLRYTKWPFNTFLTYHRAIAWVTFSHMVFHSIAFAFLAVYKSTYPHNWGFINWNMGHLATVAAAVMVTVAIRPIRSRVYELFYQTHISGFVIFLVGLGLHCHNFGWMGWVYTSGTIFLYNELSSIAKIFFCGWNSIATLTLFEEGMFKIVVTTSGRWNFFPGCYCYIIARPNLLQGHPFSIYVAPDNTSTPGNAQLTMVVKPRKGKTARLTRMLQDHYESTGSRSMQTRLYVDGPYGNQQPLSEYANILLVSGGVGVTAAYGYASYITGLQQSPLRSTRALQIIFVWIVHDARSLKWFQTELLHLIKSPNVKVEIYITRGFLDKDDSFVPSTRVYQAFQLERWVLCGSPTAPMISRSVPIETIEAVKHAPIKITNPTENTNYFDTTDTPPRPLHSAGSTLTSHASPMLSAFPPPPDNDTSMTGQSLDPGGTARTLDPNVLSAKLAQASASISQERKDKEAAGDTPHDSDSDEKPHDLVVTPPIPELNHPAQDPEGNRESYHVPEKGKFKIEMSKPEVAKLLSRHFSDITNDDSVGVFVCGPEKFNDEVRAAFVTETEIHGNIRMDYFEESFC
ncbi:ferric reductase like transmembrane component-domain-containing protein [Yarrowia lipolytica]|uniref:Ferric reductase like transmembrane component-domain-containing protein n=1 Tax=Yarrowia lipolytica TaxID=4952 RepID=A0A371BYE3_YARLL|nr:ferric reductase like transmembrane component-domain-containing protein [Yarrowia lipolytica]RDW33939.1 ferric reductase like transmembrane component-domain-containing protein [Yarrowia lipolytica]RDW41553.1 ferric reductase like transmembrane component-domain-containing protein [Yarrowia lipolytica]RDW43079.1 ferric reductase like transmembrane component-domain-containing protein [Yarrowia lipolytica]RDW49812.1 ferric reductase like transmembrane component-domain-containing protein [Yarrowi